MTSVSKRHTGFTVNSLYKRPHERAMEYLSERATFWIAVSSVFAFVTGNMVGQHGWHVFWKSVMGEGSESTIVFDGTVSPIAAVPDYARWAAYGGNHREDTFRQVPKDLLVPLPAYTLNTTETSLESRIYAVKFMGTYSTGRGEGSHPGVDIDTPTGTPIQSIANGIVTRVGNDPYGFGNYIVVKHPNVPDADSPGKRTSIHSIYAHLSSVVTGEGMTIRKGDLIGYSGQTGSASGPHLHFQIDKDSAPWHPYWPFTSAEARDAHGTITQAVNSGLHRERGLEHTLDGMLFVQTYSSGAPVVTVASHSSSSVVTKAPRMSVADRRNARLARRGIDGTTLIAYTEDAPTVQIPAPTEAHSAASASSSAPSTSTQTENAAGVRIESENSRTREREWKTITLVLLDRDGRELSTPTPGRKMALRAAYGKAEFRPSAFSTGDFRDGRLDVQVLPLGGQTLVIEVIPFGTLSRPMKMER